MVGGFSFKDFMLKIKRKCLECKLSFEKFISKSELNKGKGKFCSRICFHKSYTRRFMIGSKNPKWKGNKVTYSGIHEWIRRKLGKPSTCWDCGKTDLKNHHIQWANISGKYKRDLNDWIRLCVPCHRKLDLHTKLND